MIPPEILQRLRSYADRVDHLAPGALSGLYGVGSVALGDFQPPLSNIDVLAVSDAPWTGEGLRGASQAINLLGLRRQPARIACVTWSELAADPARVEPPCFRGRRQLPSAELVNPLTWQVLRTSGVCVRGPEYPDIGSGELRAWAADRIAGWWGPWYRRSRDRPGALWFRRSTTERVLEVARLAQVVSSGRVISKSEAGELALSASSERFQRILKDAVGFRRGLRASMYWGPFERKRDAFAYIESWLGGER